MATTAFKGETVTTVGELPAEGSKAPAFELVGADLGTVSSADLSGRRVVLNIFPSLDTDTCAMSVRRFNEIAAGLENTTVVCASKDLPFAQARFCGAEGLENVVTGSAFRSSFGEDYGVTQTGGPLQGLLARAVVVLDADGTVLHSQLAPEISEEPDYEAATAALG
jgi:thiol peroxidase